MAFYWEGKKIQLFRGYNNEKKKSKRKCLFCSVSAGIGQFCTEGFSTAFDPNCLLKWNVAANSAQTRAELTIVHLSDIDFCYNCPIL